MRHPHILELVAGCTDTFSARKGSGSLAIVTEFAANGDLRDVLMVQPSQLLRSQWLQMTVDIAQGLGYLHSLKPPIIHRALKAQNCMVDRAWRVRVADFGLSGRISKDNQDAGHHMDLASPTTATMAAYMSPKLLQLSGAKSRSRTQTTSFVLSTTELTELALRRAAGPDIWAYQHAAASILLGTWARGPCAGCSAA
jgi:serine/threonine-protein kinase CTR1|eukprot:COSAG01_NODE_885_length_12924_cov_63.044990_7_plen_197_part_00